MREQAHPQIGRYTLYGKIAAGGMASVHFGRLLGGAGFSRTVAIKRLHAHMAGEPEFASTLIDEARLVARIHHPNVVPTLDVVAAEGELLVVMEYVRGESLGRLLKAGVERGLRIPLPIASAIALGALSGLHAAHEATSDQGIALGIVHRDVSPQNILVGVDGVARIIDFGVAKAAGRLQTTREGELKGKMGYMSPEQLDERPATPASDVYALSIVLWEMLANKRLFVAATEAAVFGKALAGAKEPPSRHAPDLPAGLDALVMKGLARDPGDRFVSAKAMAEALVRVVSPALAMEVGAWVEQIAGDGLARRAAELAEIESSSGMTVPPSRGEGGEALASAPESGRRPADDIPTITSKSSSLSLKTSTPAGVPRSLLSWRLVALFAVLGLAGVGALQWRGSSPALHATAGPASAPPSASPPPLPAEPTARAAAQGSAASAPSASAAAASPPSATVVRRTPEPQPPLRASRPSSAQKPAASAGKGPTDTVEASGF
jgi:eukaryotic-like serine/threonine-protein kinase